MKYPRDPRLTKEYLIYVLFMFAVTAIVIGLLDYFQITNFSE